MIYLKGSASSWYHSVYEMVIKNGTLVSCRQGLGMELDSPVHIEIPSADGNFAALATAITQRRAPTRQRVGFSVAHGIQKFIGLPDSYLAKKYPIMLRYIRAEEETQQSRIGCYLRERLPTTITNNAPWISDYITPDGVVSSIDQLHYAIALLRNKESSTSRRAFIDFNEGFKPRCVSSWHFIVRDGALNMFQNVRSNDLLVGLPNDLVAARVAQMICAAIIGVRIGTLHHHASVVQFYRPDCAGVDGGNEFSKIIFEDDSQDIGHTLAKSSSLANAFIQHIEGTDFASLETVDALSHVRGGLSRLLSSYIDSDQAISTF